MSMKSTAMNNKQTRLRHLAEEQRIPLLRKTEEALFIRAVQTANPRRILEIGTGIGYTALLLANCAPQAEIVTIESFPVRYAEACRRLREAGVAERVQVICGRAETVLPKLHGPFDLLWLDGPKGHYLAHLRLAEPLLTKNATVLADNVLFRGYVEGTAAVPRRMRTIAYRMREFLAYVQDARRYETVLYRAGDGLTVSRRKDIDEEIGTAGAGR